MSKAYEQAGVSLTRGYDSVQRIKSHVKRTVIRGAMGAFGDFGGAFDLSSYDIKEPVLVSGTDGVGTKLLIAQAADRHDTIGIDLVAMCVNDIVTSGARPLFFLDYIASGVIDPDIVEEIVKGVADGCQTAGCALVGGETAEMPDLYEDGHYDLAGYATGVVEKAKMLDKQNVRLDDVVIGLPSSGLHANGFSLVRKILFKDHDFGLDDVVSPLTVPLEDELLKPTRIYVKPVLDVLAHHKVHAIAHITGGGFHENIPRALPHNMGVTIRKDRLPQLPVFELLQERGNIDEDEMYHVFNMGISMVLIVPGDAYEEVLHTLSKHDLEARTIGVVTNHPGVTIR